MINQKINIWKFSIGLLILIICHNTQAQVRSLRQINGKFETINYKQPYNKLYLSTDKHIYLNTDTLFFQAYLTNPKTNLLEKKTAIINVVLVSKENKTLEHIKIRINKGLGTGYIIPQTNITTDEYKLMAFSESMKNYSPQFFFSKKILFFNECTEVIEREEKLKISFYAEGNSFVTGVSNMISIKAEDELGHPIKINGVLNKSDKIIGIINTDSNGLGVFYINHEKNKKYSVSFTYQGQEIKVDLPQFSDKGIAINMRQKGNLIDLTARLSDHYRKNNDSTHFAFHNGTRLVFLESIKTKNKKGFLYKIPTDMLSQGLYNLVLLDSKFKLIGERAFFVDKKQKQSVKLEIQNSQNIQARDRVSITLDLINQTQGSSFSVSVIDQKLIDIYPNQEANPETYQYLTSELKGEIHNPNYYLTLEGKKHLNNMLISKSGSRVNWSELLSNTSSSNQYSYNKFYLSYKANAYYTESNLPVADSTLIAFYSPKTSELIEVYTSKKGKLDINMYSDFINQKDFNYQAINRQSENLKEIEVKINPEILFIPNDKLADKAKSQTIIDIVSNEKKTSQHLINCDKYLLDYQKRNRIVKDINKSYNYYINNQSGKKIKKAETNTLFEHYNAKPDLTISLKDYVSFKNMHEVIREILYNVTIRTVKKDTTIRIIRKEKNQAFDDSPLFLINGELTYNINEFLNLIPEKIESIEVVSTISDNSVFKSLRLNGLIVVNHKGKKKIGKRKQINLVGIQAGIPKVKNKSEINSTIPDFKSTIYWNPIRRVKENLAKIEYYHSDDISEFLISIQGINEENGTFFNVELPYKVKIKN